MAMVMEIFKKEKEYKAYIEEHINNVSKAFDFMTNSKNSFMKVLFSDKKTYEGLKAAVKQHDASKYSKEEFQAYRKNFFPINEEEKTKSKDEFDKAWLHHWANNTHHWQNRENSLEFNIVATLEMVADWIAMGYKFNDRALDYYRKNKEEIKLNENERELTEIVLVALYEEEI